MILKQGQTQGTVLVHCYYGRSRSATVVIAFLMAKVQTNSMDKIKMLIIMITIWSQFDYNLITIWSQFDHNLITIWSLAVPNNSGSCPGNGSLCPPVRSAKPRIHGTTQVWTWPWLRFSHLVNIFRLWEAMKFRLSPNCLRYKLYRLHMVSCPSEGEDASTE